MKGISLHTKRVFEYLSRQDFIQEYILVGGTALSLQIQKRISEDLDFCIFQDRQGDAKAYEIKWYQIEKVLRSEFGEVGVDLLDLQQVNFKVNDVKLTFFVRQGVDSSVIHTKLFESVRLADIRSIGAMKLELLQRRNTFRDYYDIYSILKEGFDFIPMADTAIKYSRKKVRLKSLLSILSKAENFTRDSSFSLLEPFYDVDAREIRDYILERYGGEMGIFKM